VKANRVQRASEGVVVPRIVAANNATGGKGLELHPEKTRLIDLSFRTGNATAQFVAIDRYVGDRLHGLRRKRRGSRITAGRADAWRRPFFEALGLIRLRGTIRYPGVAHATT
jgi:hypothetical protein